MKNILMTLVISIAFITAGCGSDQQGHSHGEGADHTHETPAHQSSGDDSDAVHIGSPADSVNVEAGHSHHEDEDHYHEEEHSHDDDSTHTHGDEEHDH